MRTFDFYEFTGILGPGAVVLFFLSLAYPDLQPALANKEVSVGGFGIFVILAYVVGHLVQALGNVLERMWWGMWGGMPTDWVRSHSRRLLDDSQTARLEGELPGKLGLDGPVKLKDLSSGGWFGLTRQIYALVAAQSRAGRVETFNGNYGLNRGIAVALILGGLLTATREPPNWLLAAAAFAGSLLAIYRMHRFGIHYARELFVQFLQLTAPIKLEPTTVGEKTVDRT